MIQIKKTLTVDLNITNFFFDWANKDVLFFDIETTGFSSKFSSIYLISCIYYHKNQWHLVQLMDNTKKDEKKILQKFIELCKFFKVMFHFNGKSFDLPFLQNRATSHNLNWPEHYLDVDLYQIIKPYKTIFQLDNVKLKTVEAFMGVEREDLYTGGELITQYHDYVISQDSQLMKNLLLHNGEDVTSLLGILPILEYIKYVEDLKKHCIPIMIDSSHVLQDSHCEINLILEQQLPFDLLISFNDIRCVGSAKSKSLCLKIPLISTSLFCFFDNVQEYYFIEEIDEAIHESVARFYPPNKRKRANKSNCYTKKKGTFVPFFEETSISLQLFYDEKRKKPYILFEEFQENKTALNQWIIHFFEIALPG